MSEHRLDGGPVTYVCPYVEDVDSIIPAGAVAEDCPWGMREARLTDPDGNEVRVGSPRRKRKPAAQAQEERGVMQGAAVVGVPVISLLQRPASGTTAIGTTGSRDRPVIVPLIVPASCRIEPY